MILLESPSWLVLEALKKAIETDSPSWKVLCYQEAATNKTHCPRACLDYLSDNSRLRNGSGQRQLDKNGRVRVTVYLWIEESDRQKLQAQLLHEYDRLLVRLHNSMRDIRRGINLADGIRVSGGAEVTGSTAGLPTNVNGSIASMAFFIDQLQIESTLRED